MKKDLTLGLTALIFANLFWGIMTPMTKDLFKSELIDGMTLSVVRMVSCTVLFWVLGFLIPDKYTHQKRLEKRDIIPLLVGSILFIIGTQSLTNIGTQYTYAIDASVCCCVTPIFTLILGAIFYHHKFPPLLKIVGVLLGLGGVLVFIFSSTENVEMHVTNPVWGDLLCVFSQASGAIYLVFYVNIVSRYSAFTIMKWLYTFSTICILPFTFGDVISIPWAEMSGYHLFTIAFAIFFGSFASYMLIAFAQQHVTPTIIGMCNYGQPLASAVFSAILGIAVFTVQSVIATLLIFVGIWLVIRKS